MSVRRVAVLVASLSALCSGTFAVDRWANYRRVEKLREEAAEELVRATRVAASRGPASGKPVAPPDASMKTAVREAAAKAAIPISSMSESERDAGKDQWEKQCFVRFDNVPHSKLVLCLAEVESGGSGRVKEIRLRPSPIVEDCYLEAEVVVSRVVSGGRKP